MTAHELARKLLDGPDVMVTVKGHEGGVNELQYVDTPGQLVLNYYGVEEHWYGRHKYDEQDGTVTAIHLT